MLYEVITIVEIEQVIDQGQIMVGPFLPGGFIDGGEVFEAAITNRAFIFEKPPCLSCLADFYVVMNTIKDSWDKLNNSLSAVLWE